MGKKYRDEIAMVCHDMMKNMQEFEKSCISKACRKNFKTATRNAFRFSKH
jgi:hypothetical protein